MSDTTITKHWKRMGLFNTYEEALARKNEVSVEYNAHEDKNLLVKIKRCGPEGTKFQVKMWHPDMATSNKNKKSK